ncbi:MAG: hypothetical protein AAFO76_01385 [Cyanobacteria bacterium J06607_15]
MNLTQALIFLLQLMTMIEVSELSGETKLTQNSTTTRYAAVNFIWLEEQEQNKIDL